MYLKKIIRIFKFLNFLIFNNLTVLYSYQFDARFVECVTVERFQG